MFWSSPAEGGTTSFPPSTSESESSSSNSTEGSSPFISSLFLLVFSSSTSPSPVRTTKAVKLDERESKCKTGCASGSAMTLNMIPKNNNNHRNQQKGRLNHKMCHHSHNQRKRHHKGHECEKLTCDYECRNLNSSSVTSDKRMDCLKYNKWEISAAVIIIMVLSVSVYWNSLDGDFVHDDVVSIVRNADVLRSHSVLSWWNLWWNDYWGAPMSSQLSHKSYRPLTVLTFRINYWLAGGLSATVFHATNIMIHALVSLLMFFVCLQVLRMSLVSSLTASAIFAVHPVHTEAVAGITGRSDALACFLMLISFLLYSKSIVCLHRRNTRETMSDSEEESSTDSSGHSGSSSSSCNSPVPKEPLTIHNYGLTPGIIASGLVGCTAMLAKETGITVMGINILYDLYIHWNFVKRWLVTKAEDQSQTRLRRRVTFMITLISVSLGARLALMNGTFPRFSQQDNPAAYSRSDLTRFLTYAFLPVFNAWLMICPFRLSYDWQMGSIPLVESLWDVRNVYSVVFYSFYCGLIHKAFATKGRRAGGGGEGPRIFFAILFISLPFLPASNLLFPVGFVAAERVLYSTSVGVCILTAHGIDCMKKRLPQSRKFVVLSLCLMLMSFSLKTWDRNFVWKSRASLFESGVRENPRNAKVHYNYANLQKDLGDIETAVKHYKIAIRLWPTYASAYNNLGALSEDMLVAEDSFLRAIHANPQHNGAHFNLGVIYMRSEKYEEALEHLEECLKIDPSHVEALQYLGACYNVLNKTHEAENVFHKLISSDLPPSKLHTNFGVFLEELGLTSKALTHFLLALTKTSWDVQALVHAAKLAYQLGAEDLFHELSERLMSLKFDPGVGYMLAVSYMEKGKLLDAKLLFEKLSEESDSFYKIHYAQLLIKVRRWSDAEWAVKGIHSSDPNHPISVLLLAQIYENLNKTMDAYELLNCAVDNFCPQEANLCAQFYSQLGNLMHTTGAFLSAANYYDMAIKFNPNSVQAHTNIGAIYHLMSNYKQAESHYLAALAIEPRNQVVLSNIKKLERAQNSAAATVVTSSHSHHNNNHHHHNHHEHLYHNSHSPHLGGPLHQGHKFHFSWR